MALTLKKFSPDLQRQLRIIALEEKQTLCQLIEKLLTKDVEKYQEKVDR